MPGQSRNLDKTELQDFLGKYSSESGLFLPDCGFDDGGSNIELRNPEVTVRTMPENEDFDNGRDNRYELHCFLSISETSNTTKTKFVPVSAILNALSCSYCDRWVEEMVNILLVFQTGPLFSKVFVCNYNIFCMGNIRTGNVMCSFIPCRYYCIYYIFCKCLGEEL
jgi:hypothetical protein